MEESTFRAQIHMKHQGKQENGYRLKTPAEPLPLIQKIIRKVGIAIQIAIKTARMYRLNVVSSRKNEVLRRRYFFQRNGLISSNKRGGVWDCDTKKSP
ncbi:hypothetical protein L1049_004108 [Liquidambar formosana]|uniref:Uncharacterized protein n=1 Tax=Liquidambar formosana TaxID=63359 RepID=A0AAP0X0J7_LIQFO